MDTLRFPSKTFLLGEYAVLQGSSALLLGHVPFFTATIEPAAILESPFHPESLAGAWLKKNPVEARLRFQDPHGGRGGYGGSGAEFLTAWAAERALPNPDAPRAIFAWSAWEDSRELPGSGSGADILTQAFGFGRHKPFFLEIDIPGRSLREVYAKPGQGRLALFHTGQKVATHSLTAPVGLPVAELEKMVLRGCDCLEAGDFAGFGRELSLYGESLAELGLQAPHTGKAVAALRGLPGVVGGKGCGAMGADVILVAHTGEANLEAWAKENSLALTAEIPV